MTRAIIVSSGAEADLIEIWDYTSREHGEDAADEYVAALDRAMMLAVEFPGIGTDCSAIRAGYRRLRSGSHLIYYTADDRRITVVRVLHERMDVTRQLN